MTLYQMSYVYRADALAIRMRITALRAAAKETDSEEEAAAFKRRIADLQVLLRQSRELADLTRHYYERSYHRDAKYTL